MAMVVKRFDVFLVSLDPTVRVEIRKTRPCVLNQHIRSVIIAPMTTQRSTLRAWRELDMKIIGFDKPDNWGRVLITICLGALGCGRPQVAPSAAATLVFPERASDQMIWPQNQTWIWSINRLDKPGGRNSVVAHRANCARAH